MIFINLNYLDNEFELKKGDIEIDNGKIIRIADKIAYTDSDMVVDCDGYKAIPGFVDVHIHGAVTKDTCDREENALFEMAKFLLSKGVTSFAPTTMTLSEVDITDTLLTIKNARDKQTEGASIVGINLEGPFISKKKKGAQADTNIISPDFEMFKKWYDVSDGLIKIVDIAPEEDGAEDFIKKATEICTVSLAHSTADYNTAKKAFDDGITHATHLFNAMTGLHHRDPGAVGAIFTTDTVMAEIICDGIHIHPEVVKLVFSIMGDRLIVVSDAMRLAGCEDGQEGDLGGQTVTVVNGKATLKDGTIAGSATNLYDEFLNLLSWGIPFNKVVKAITLNPAKSIGMDKEIGSLKVGKRADILILDDENNIVAVYH